MYIACVSLRITSRHTPLVTRAQSQFRVTLQFYPACGLALYAKGHHSLSSPFGVPCILSSTIFLRSASRRVTHHRHASLVTISLCFYLAFHCITLPAVIFALLEGCCYSASISLRVTHRHNLRVTCAVTLLSQAASHLRGP